MNARARGRPSAQPETAKITDLSHEGRGVAHVDGKTVFIDDALPGELVEWRRIKRGRNFDEGQLLRVIEPSPDRVEPRCIHFGMCGGCVLQHLAVDQQLQFKQKQLMDSLTRIGKVTPRDILPPLQASTWNYRRRARLAARWVPKKHRTVVGFRERSTPYITDLRRCEVLQPPMDQLLVPLSELVTALSIRNRVPQIEVAVADNAVALVVRVLEPLTESDTELLRGFGREHSVQMFLQPGGYETVAPMDEAAPLEYRLPAFDLTLQFLPTDFVQVNGPLNLQMIDRAMTLLAPAANDRVLDLFCGLGNFSLPLARRAGQVIGVEGEAGLVERARANAARNGLTNVQFHTANLADESIAMAQFTAPWAGRFDKVLLDPPRAGAKEVLPVVAKSGADTVLYISCHPGSLARDAGILVHEHGYKLQAAGVMDMFPHTAHVESAALFTK
ncbi:23S rRNA (uracil(1939)-C(5))-methyltransferase RlmD [Steroidobacter gossypii]|uniref:23S rRNA (uracil(1939)-C(5))-methyltransferase RlmD n=1 Tax=Steroidobacter gossypii TaxID=2805490 RepID=UPI001E65DD6D|nr:23S rRNA (uracil(1939)-C(5))-methyltransferase RlmD [Steroidobacter gossypii]